MSNTAPMTTANSIGSPLESVGNAAGASKDSATLTTLPQLLLNHAAARPKAVAMRHHELGRWKQTTWAELAKQVESIAFGMKKLGIGIGSRVALVGANHPTMVAADLAALSLGAITIPIEAGLSPLTLTTLIRKTVTQYAIVGDQQQYDKIGTDPQTLSTLTTVIIADTRGMHDLETATWAGELVDVLALSQLVRGGIGSIVDIPTSVRQRRLEDPATIDVYALYGSTTETVVRTHGELAAASLQHHPDVVLSPGDELLAVLSMARPRERALTEVAWLQSGATLNLGMGGPVERLELQQVQPTVVQLDAARLGAIGNEMTHRLTTRSSVESKAKRRISISSVGLGFRLFSGLGHRLRVNSAMKTLGNVRSGVSRSSARDSRIFKALGAGAIVACLLLNSQLRSVDGLARIGLCAAVIGIFAGLALRSGVAIRPFVRKAYGLNRTRHLVAFDALPESVVGLFSGLHLAPTGTSSTRSTPLAGTELDAHTGASPLSTPASSARASSAQVSSAQASSSSLVSASFVSTQSSSK
jgi:AMP-binding enzyme